LGFKTMEDWYQITFRELQKHVPIALIHKYNDSPTTLLQALFPHHPFKFWRFIQ
jgi:hypothetical protein